MDREAWKATVLRMEKSQTQLKRLSMHTCIGEENGNPLQYSCLENPRDEDLVGCRLWGHRESDTTEVT